jgi:hypothetical protein
MIGQLPMIKYILIKFQLKLQRLELMHESNPTTISNNLVQILKLEAREGNAKKGSSCSKAFVWLTR